MRLQNNLRSIRSFIPSSWTSFAACVCLAGFVLVPAGAQTTPQSSRELVLTVGKSLLVNSAANIERIAVGFGEVAEARAVGPKEILIDGKAPGETSLIIWQEGGNKLFFDVTVRPNTATLRTRLDTVRRQIQEQLPGQNITVNFENDSIFLSGTAKDLVSVGRATAIASSVGKVVNLLYVDVPPTDTQILLKVQFASVDRNNTTELGLNLISTGATNTIGRVTTGQFSPPAVTTPTGGPPTLTLSDALNFFLFRPDLNLGATIKALQTRGLFEILAEPNVLAINGKQASFLAGGEFPYPILQGGGGGLGTVTVAFREFGVRINFLPVVTPRGTIRLEVAPEVSALDFAAGLSIQGSLIPGLTTRRMQTEIELNSGQSFAIGGLLDRRLTETIQKIPLLSSIPLLGQLFQSKSANRQNTELLVIITPEIVRPIPQGQALPHLEYPVPLNGPDAMPRTPGLGVTGQAPVTQANPSIPLEQLLDSLKVQDSMKLQGSTSVSGGSITPLPGGFTPPAAPPPAAPPPAAPAPLRLRRLRLLRIHRNRGTYIMRHKLFLLALLATLTLSIASAATFGRVVPVGGPASDIALDEGRGFLYIANYTSARIDVMSLSDNTISRSMSVAAYPGGLAISPDGHYLVVTHYASSNGSALTHPGQDAVTVIDLTNNQKRTFGLSSGPVGVAFGIDGMALILTQDEFLLLDPASGATTVLGAVANVKSQTLPVGQATFPPQIIGGSLMATADGSHIFGIGGTTPDTGSSSQVLLFSYKVSNRSITAAFGLTTSPSLAPRVLSVSRDGSYYMTGWALIASGPGFLGDPSALGPLVAQFPGAQVNSLSVGSVAIRSSKGLIYGQITPGAAPPSSTSQTLCFDNGVCYTQTTPGTTAPTTSSAPTNLMVMDADNLNVRERIQLPERLAGKSVFNSDESVMYAISDSGITVLPMAQLDKAPRVIASQEDVVFRGNFCAGGAITQTIDITDPSGNAVPFQIQAAATAPGITITPSSGVTPARVTISIDPGTIRSLIGTKAYQFEIFSASAVNMPKPPSRGALETNYKTNVRSRFRVLVNNRAPENRGAFFDAPGQLVDALADPARSRFYLLRQDTNQVLVYDAASYNLVATLRTGNTPTQMAITFDRNYLLVANDNSQIANRYDLNSLQQLSPIVFPLGHYPRSIAASGKALLAASRVAGSVNTIDLIDLTTLTASPLPSLGPYKNDIHVSTTLAATPNGADIIAAMPDGRMLMYNANVDAFTVSRKDFPALKGPLAASSFGQYVVDHYMLNESLVTMGPVVSASDSPSGFAFVDQDGYSSAVSAAGNGLIQNLKAGQLQSPLATIMVESPLLGDTDYPFMRTLAPLADRSAIISLTTSGFTVLPWNYAAATATPLLDGLVSAGDFTKPVAPGGLVSLFGSRLSPMTLSSTDVPLPTVLADSCLTANGVVLPMVFVSPTQINAQLPFQINGNTDVVLRTPGGTSDVLRITILPAAPSVFRSGVAGPVTDIPTIVRVSNNGLVTASNPIHTNDHITIYLTGMGQTSPEVAPGAAAPSAPLSYAKLPVTVTIGGTSLFVDYAGLAPGMVGVYQINALVPFKGVPTGFDIPLTISQGGASTTVPVRMVN